MKGTILPLILGLPKAELEIHTVVAEPLLSQKLNLKFTLWLLSRCSGVQEKLC
jgi:hypothetical protein